MAFSNSHGKRRSPEYKGLRFIFQTRRVLEEWRYVPKRRRRVTKNESVITVLGNYSGVWRRGFTQLICRIGQSLVCIGWRLRPSMPLQRAANEE